MSEARPLDCRFRSQEEGRPYPRSSCRACGRTITTGLGNHCYLESYLPERTYSQAELDEAVRAAYEDAAEVAERMPSGDFWEKRIAAAIRERGK